MNIFIVFLIMVATIVANGNVSDNTTSHCFREIQCKEEQVQHEKKTENTNEISKSTDEVESNVESAIEKNEVESMKSHILDDNFSNIDNKGGGWGFVKKKNAEPEIYQSTQEFFAQYNTYYVDPARDKKIYLTFDEGYENGYTSIILDVLKEHNVKAAFFITGPYLEKEYELVDRMINEGHIVGNHTVNHPNLHKLSDAQLMADELGGLNNKFYERYGKNMKYMRPPQGEYSQRLLAVANQLGYKTVFWSFAYRDWEVNNQKGAEYAYEQITPYLHNGAILLLHAVSKDNAECLGEVIKYAKEQGYIFATLDELKQY